MREIALILFGAVIGFLVSRIQSRLDKRRSAKDEFGVFIQERISELSDRGVGEFYDRTKLAIRLSVARFSYFLSGDQRSRLERLWREYDSIPADQLDRINENDWAKELHEIDGSEFQHPHQIIGFYLEQFRKLAA